MHEQGRSKDFCLGGDSPFASFPSFPFIPFPLHFLLFLSPSLTHSDSLDLATGFGGGWGAL